MIRQEPLAGDDSSAITCSRSPKATDGKTPEGSVVEHLKTEKKRRSRSGKSVRWSYGSKLPIPPWLLSQGVRTTDLNLDSWIPDSIYDQGGKAFFRVMCELAKIEKPRHPRFIRVWVVPRYNVYGVDGNLKFPGENASEKEKRRGPISKHKQKLKSKVLGRNKTAIPFWLFNREKVCQQILSYADEIEMIVANSPRWVDCAVKLAMPKKNIGWFGTVIRIEDVREGL